MMIKTTNLRIKREAIARVYSGKARTCMCGCAGTYSEKPAQITRVLNIIQAQPEAMIDAEFIAVDVGDRTYCIYFKEAAQS